MHHMGPDDAIELRIPDKLSPMTWDDIEVDIPGIDLKGLLSSTVWKIYCRIIDILNPADESESGRDRRPERRVRFRITEPEANHAQVMIWSDEGEDIERLSEVSGPIVRGLIEHLQSLSQQMLLAAPERN